MLIVGTAIFTLVAICVVIRMHLPRSRAWVTVFAFGLTMPAFALVAPSAGAAPVVGIPLATSGNYSVLAATTVTNTGATVLAGSVGVSPGSAVTGFPPGLVTPPATIDVAGAADQAQSDLTIAYVDAAGRAISATTTADLAGLRLTSGVYSGPDKSALGLTGTLTLDAEGDTDAVFIFQTDSTLITGSSSTVALVNGAQACNVFWQVGSSATLGTGSVFVGTVLAQASVTVTSNVTVHGRTLARTGAVTLDDDVFTDSGCAPAESTTTTGAGSTTSSPTTASTTTSAAPTTTVDSSVPGGPTTTVAAPTTTVEVPVTTVAPGGTTTTVDSTVPGGPTTTVAVPVTTVVPGGTTTTTDSSGPGGPTTPGGVATTAPQTSATTATSGPTATTGDRSTTTVAIVGQHRPSGSSGSPGAASGPGRGTGSNRGSAQLAQTGWPTIPALAAAGLLIAAGTISVMAGRRRTARA